MKAAQEVTMSLIPLVHTVFFETPKRGSIWYRRGIWGYRGDTGFKVVQGDQRGAKVGSLRPSVMVFNELVQCGRGSKEGKKRLAECWVKGWVRALGKVRTSDIG